MSSKTSITKQNETESQLNAIYEIKEINSSRSSLCGDDSDIKMQISEELLEKRDSSLNDTENNENKILDETMNDNELDNSITSHSQEQELEDDSSGLESSDSKSKERKSLNLFENPIEILANSKQLKIAKTKAGFFDGRPKDVDEILKFECPLYSCGKKTIITNFLDKKQKIKTIRPSATALEFQKKKSNKIPSKSQVSPGDKRNQSVGKKRNAIISINFSNSFKIKTFNSLFMTILQIINIIIRYTIIQFPFCLKTLGMIWGSITIVLVASMSIYSIYMLIKVRESTHEKWWGMTGKLLILILNMMQSFGSCLSYIIIYTKTLPKLIKFTILSDANSDKLLLTSILGLWLLVYCFQKDVSGVKSAAKYGVIVIFFFLILNVTNFLYLSWKEEFPEDSEINIVSIETNEFIVSCINCIILSFSFHTYAFSIYECLEDPNPRKMIVTSAIGIFISMLVYLLVGCIGYIIYGNTISEDILSNVGSDNRFISDLSNITFAFIVVTSFPLTFSSLKHYFIYFLEITLTLIRDKINKKKNKENSIDKNQKTSIALKDKDEASHDKNIHYDKKNEHNSNTNNHGDHLDLIHIPEYIEYILILGVFLGIFFFSLNYPDLKIVFSFLGGTTANIFTFILPAMYFIKFSNHNSFDRKNIIPTFFIIIGIAGMIVSFKYNIDSLSKKKY